jgi:photoactive yellow protein
MRFDELVAHAEAVTDASQAKDPVGLITERLAVERLSEDEFNTLPFGAIQLDEEGRILRYNNYESKLSGIKQDMALGKHFFTELAPCTNVKEFYGRFKEGVARRKLYEKFRYHFSFKRDPIDVTITLYYSDLTSSIWVFVRPV